ncbi:MAG: redox-sensing transcriptional repressor Rex [Candidatus Atribacteria bacterium]|nr:redox-sensing transcriptional repressor Rex [Candidatus Atribacteria bacterium]
MKNIPPKSAQRLIRCYHLAQESRTTEKLYLTSRAIASLLGVDETQVRKDMALIEIEGIPKKGYPVDRMIKKLETLFGIRKERLAVLVGAGNLGKALINYPRFSRYGVRIGCAFEKNPEKHFTQVGGITVYPVEKMKEMARTLKAEIGIIAIPPQEAQEMAMRLVEAGIRGIWNFSPTLLRLPPGVVVRNECLETGLVTLLYELERGEGSCISCAGTTSSPSLP